MKTLVTLFLSFFISLISVAQTKPVKTVIQGNFIQIPAKTICLWSTVGKNMELVDSVQVVKGHFSFPPAFHAQGVYLLGVSESNHIPILLDNSEPTVEINFDKLKLESGFHVIQSKQNTVFHHYVPRENKINQAIRGAHKKEGNDSTIIQAQESLLALLRDSIYNAFPHQYLGKCMQWKSDVLPLNKKTFWSKWDFSDTSLIHNTYLNDRIQRYMRKFSKGEQSGYIQCANEILDLAAINEVVYEYTVYQMIIGFYESGMDVICSYLIDNKLNSESCGEDDIHKLLTKTVNSVQQLTIGHQPPNFSGTTLKNEKFELRGFCSQHQYTIIMFWSSWCEHCKAAAPEIKAFQDKYGPKKISLVGYSLDGDKVKWKEAVQERQFDFPNLFGGKNWDSPVAKLYRVNKTPQFYVLDKSGTIVLKAKTMGEIESFLSKK